VAAILALTVVLSRRQPGGNAATTTVQPQQQEPEYERPKYTVAKVALEPAVEEQEPRYELMASSQTPAGVYIIPHQPAHAVELAGEERVF
jgi:hypothetical protein